MKFLKEETYKATCIVEQTDLTAFGLTADDIFERSDRGREFIGMARDLAMKNINEEWPGCAFSMQMSAYQNGDIALTFSETIEDFVYGLQQSLQLTGEGPNAEMLNKLITEIQSRDEASARTLIRNFEANVRAAKES